MDGLDVDAELDRVADEVEGGLAVVALAGHDQAKMARGQVVEGQPGDRAQHRHGSREGDGLANDPLLPAGSNAIQDDPGKG